MFQHMLKHMLSAHCSHTEGASDFRNREVSVNRCFDRSLHMLQQEHNNIQYFSDCYLSLSELLTSFDDPF